MPHRFDDFKVGRKDSIWVEFDRTYLNFDGIRCYKFNCHVEPIFCVSDDTIYFVKYRKPIYAVKSFTVISDKSGKYIDLVRLGSEPHPHKNPSDSFLCIGDFKGKVLHPETIKQMVFLCMMKYNEMDCYCVPDIRVAEKSMVKKMEDNTCQIS